MNPFRPKVLIVEDEPAACSLLSGYLEDQGWDVQTSEDGRDVVCQVLADDYDLVFLDLRLPGLDGISLCREIRSQHPAGIVITTSLDDPVERIVGLEAGADAYYSKPLPMRELIAGSKALLRRVQDSKQLRRAGKPGIKNYYFDDWRYDGERHTIIGLGGETALSHNEALIMQALCESAGRVVKRDSLMKVLGKPDWLPFDRTLDVLVGRLRHKLRQVIPQSNLIAAQYGRGYMLNAASL